MTRTELSRLTGLSRTTVSNLVTELIDEGLAAESAQHENGGRLRGAGRPAAAVRLRPAAGVAVGIDVGARHVAVAVGDLSHRVLAERWVDLPWGHGSERGMHEAVALVDRLLAESGVARDDVIGVGMGLPAPISGPGGLVASSNILPGWAGMAVAEDMTDRLGLPVAVDNDANLGALAEAIWGAGADCDQLAYIKVATGIGAGLLHDGRLFRGTSGTAGEIGHTTVAEDGPVCRCGNRGCLELYAGGSALLAAVGTSHPEVDRLERLIALAGEGDPACSRVITDAGRHIGVAMANLVNLLNPRRIVVGGELSRAGETLLEPMRTAVRRSAVRSAVDAVEIVPGILAERAEVLGGLALVLREPARFATVAD